MEEMDKHKAERQRNSLRNCPRKKFQEDYFFFVDAHDGRGEEKVRGTQQRHWQ